jgi:putative DNA primase/helicase
VTIVAGDPGLGKSLVTLYLAACVSMGNPWPDGAGTAPVGGVVIVTAEDDLGDTVRPRLDALGANVNQVRALQGIEFREKGKAPTLRSFDLENDLPRLREAIVRTPNCKLVVIDPVSAFLGAKTDSHKDSHVRALLAPLSMLAAEFGVAVVIVSHLNKAEGRSAIQRMTGSLAFVAAARAAWLVVRDPGNGKRRLFLPIKNNIGNDESGLAFFVTSEHSENGKPVVEWTRDRVTMTADEALTASRKPSGGALGKAVEWLKEALAGGPVAQAELEKQATDAGITIGTLKRAKTELLVVSRKDKSFGEGSRWLWSLPGPQGGEQVATDEAPKEAQVSEEAQLLPFDDLRPLGDSDDSERLALLDAAEAAFGDAELGEFDLPEGDDGNWPADDLEGANDALDEAAGDDAVDDQLME